VSHAPERKEKDCLNCGTIVQGKYCHVCGQENIVPRESFGTLVLHFFSDITHFDSKFLDTLKYLLFRPGFLSKEHLKGRRSRYLNPIRMYLFTSAIFFLIFFSLLLNPKSAIKLDDLDTPLTKQKRDSTLKIVVEELGKETQNVNLKKQVELLSDTSQAVTPAELLQFKDNEGINIFGKKDYKTVKEYDSLQRKNEKAKKDNWFKRRLIRKEIILNDEFRHNPSGKAQEIFTTFLHRLPYLLFVSLPFFALLLKLLYIRRKQFFYADHIIFTIHHYIFSFLLLLVVFGINRMHEITGWGIWKGLLAILLFIWPAYLYIAMKNFYQQGWFKTLMKFLLLNLIGFAILLLLFIIFLFFSVY
jgi:Protein of unknown function (DUF3667)